MITKPPAAAVILNPRRMLIVSSLTTESQFTSSAPFRVCASSGSVATKQGILVHKVCDVAAELLANREVRAKMNAREDAAQRRLLRSHGKAREAAIDAREHFGGD